MSRVTSSTVTANTEELSRRLNQSLTRARCRTSTAPFRCPTAGQADGADYVDQHIHATSTQNVFATAKPAPLGTATGISETPEPRSFSLKATSDVPMSEPMAAPANTSEAKCAL